MIMENLYKRFEELVTKWKKSNEFDEFFVARIRLTFYYSITAVIILAVSSFILYTAILSNLSRSIFISVSDPLMAQAIIDRTQEILLNRFITVNVLIVSAILVLGFFLTHKTLEPIRLNVEKQKRFIADASHELRTPIAVIISGLEVNLSNNKLDFVSAKKTLENTLEEMKELSKLSHNLLDLSKRDILTKDYEPIILGDLIKSIVLKSRSIAAPKGIKIKEFIRRRVPVRGNKIELERVIYNILDNAIKYTPENGVINISDRIFFNKYIITVSDSGPGIPKETIDKVFDSFFRGDLSRNTPGAGLGLTMSKKIIEDHNGTISIKSIENKGTSVIISLPIFFTLTSL